MGLGIIYSGYGQTLRSVWGRCVGDRCIFCSLSPPPLVQGIMVASPVMPVYSPVVYPLSGHVNSLPSPATCSVPLYPCENHYTRKVEVICSVTFAKNLYLYIPLSLSLSFLPSLACSLPLSLPLSLSPSLALSFPLYLFPPLSMPLQLSQFQLC